MKFTKTIKFGHPLVMGILNVTPNSFSDAGKYRDPEVAALHAEAMVNEGADIIDVGGESTGPDSTNVSVDEEINRVIPVLASLNKKKFSTSPIISVDTYKSKVARAALELGVGMINDVTALRGDSMLASVVAEYDAYLVLMYSKDSTARTTRDPVQYDDVIKVILEFLEERIAVAVHAGVMREKIIIDPGMGAFISGDPKYSFEVLRRLAELQKLNCPILVGASRKSFLPGTVKDRLIPTIIAHSIAIQNGASIIRVHDVADHVLANGLLEKLL